MDSPSPAIIDISPAEDICELPVFIITFPVPCSTLPKLIIIVPEFPIADEILCYKNVRLNNIKKAITHDHVRTAIANCCMHGYAFCVEAPAYLFIDDGQNDDLPDIIAPVTINMCPRNLLHR